MQIANCGYVEVKIVEMMKIKNKHWQEIKYNIIKNSEKNVHNIEILHKCAKSNKSKSNGTQVEVNIQMSVQLLDKTRKINKLLHNNNSYRVEFVDICDVLSSILESNILVVSKKGKVLGTGFL